MRADIRVDADFIGNPKTQRLIRELGPNAIISLLALWGYAARNRPKGILRGLSPGDIAMVARWEGDPKAFVDGLVRLRWLEKRGKVYSIHDWEIHQPYAYFAEERSQAARKAAETRWKKQRGDDAGRMRDECGSYAPDPTPDPLPTPAPDRRTKPAASAGDCGPPRPTAIPQDPGRGNGPDADQAIPPELKEWGERLADKVNQKQVALGIIPEDGDA
jgi:hypothetical protein